MARARTRERVYAQVLAGTPSHFRAGPLTYSLIAATIVGIAFAVIRIQRRLGDKPAAL